MIMAAKKDLGLRNLEPPSPGPETAHNRSMFLATRYDTRMRYKSLSEDMEGSRTPTDKTMLFDYKDTLQRLDQYYRRVKRLILRFQSPTIGIFPQIGGEHTDVGWVRDSIYCGMAVWSLYQAYNRLDDDKGRIHELGQSAVKTMRGILFCWMRQADKVELFKQQQGPQFALHSKFHYKFGDAVADYNQYGHLQIDVVALYLLTMVQMISSGLQIIYTMDEASFIQNLVYYIERAYRTPDYGMWERGTRYNNGQCELHASSIGVTKAALEAINGFNVFGSFGTSSSVIYVDIDAYNRNRTIFETLLPRESSSKNTDTSLLPTMTFPCHAIHDEKLKHRTLDKAERKLRGKYGFRRFLRDGYKTVLEDTNRLHYDPGETKNFDAIESEWPMFDLFLLIDGIFKGDQTQVNFYQARVDDNVKISPEGDSMLPMYYYVQLMDIEDARKNPQSVSRRSSKEWVDGKVHLWGNAMYIIACLLTDGLLHVNELDPIRRYLPASERPRKSIRYSFFQGDASDLIVQVVLIAESSRLQSILATYGIQSQTPHQVEPIQIWSAWELVKAYDYLGLNQKFGLSGRPPRPIGVLGTSKIYRICGKLVLCYPIMFEQSDFYLSHDLDLVIDDIKADIMFLAKFWKLSGRPTFCMVIRENDLRQGPHFAEMLKLLASFKRGSCDGVKIRTGRLQNLISMSCIEHLDFLQSMPEILGNFKSFEEITSATGYKSLTDIPKALRKASMYGLRYEDYENRSTWEICQQLRNCSSLRVQCGLLHILLKREGGSYYIEDGTVIDKIERVAKHAARVKHWQVVRFSYSILGKMVDSLVPSITSVLVRGKQVTIGIFGHKEQVIDKPITPTEMKDYIYALCQPYDICQAVLQQEIIISIGKLVSTKPELFDGILKIRIGWMIHAMKLELTYSKKEIHDTTKIEELSPSAIKQLLVKVLDKDLGHRSALQKRQLNGALNRVPDDFYDRVWEILERTPGGITVAERHLPQQPTLSDLTIYERSFSLKVENLLSRIVDPAYGQIIVEMFMVVSTILRRNPELKFPAALDMDKMVDEAFGYFKEDKKCESDSMESFLDTPPDIIHGTTSYLAKAAVNNLLLGEMVKGHAVDGNVACKMM